MRYRNPFFEKIKNSDYNLSISRYKKVEHIEAEYEDPAKLIDDIITLEDDITNELKALKRLIF